MVVNWGCASPPIWANANTAYLNKPHTVAVASNKLLTFQKLKGNPDVRIPEFTTDVSAANAWLVGNSRVVGRACLSGHSGAGISLHGAGESLPSVPLYVKYIPKEKEYRVHIFNGQVIDVQQKRIRTDYSGEVNKQIRNHHTGWVYCRDNISEPTELRNFALATVQALGLSFGAVDIIYSKATGRCWVLEVNTAPGLEGTSISIYGQAILGAVN